MNFTLGEINFIVQDLKRSLSFYTTVFGFKEIENGDGYFKLDCNGQTITFLEFAKAALPDFKYGDHPSVSIDFLVENIEETVAHFKKHKIEFVEEWEPGKDHVFIYDLDRLVLEIIQADIKN